MKDIIKDTDTHFIIDGSTRLVKNDTDTKSMLVQYDHNSEIFTFRIPRKVDSHDLSQCNYVRVHFINIDKSKRAENHGIDDITDTLDICPEDDEFVICSWLITRDATQLAGSLHFVIQFAVKEGDTIKYSWNTAKYTGITIQDGINFDEKTVSESNDLLTQWENRLKASQIVKVEQTTFSDEPEGENVWTVTFGDGSTSEFKVKNGSRGPAGYVGSIQTIDGKILNFFVGTKEQYDALPVEIQQNNLFAIISDDTAQEDFFKLAGGGKITSGDLNDYYKVGNYYIEGVVDAPNISNLPIKTAGVLKVISGNGAIFNDNSEWYCIIQMFIAHSTGDMYVRSMMHNNTGDFWQPWKQVAFLNSTADSLKPVVQEIAVAFKSDDTSKIDLNLEFGKTYMLQMCIDTSFTSSGGDWHQSEIYGMCFTLSLPEESLAKYPDVFETYDIKAMCTAFSTISNITDDTNSTNNDFIFKSTVVRNKAGDIISDISLLVRTAGERNWSKYTRAGNCSTPVKIKCYEII